MRGWTLDELWDERLEINVRWTLVCTAFYSTQHKFISNFIRWTLDEREMNFGWTVEMNFRWTFFFVISIAGYLSFTFTWWWSAGYRSGLFRHRHASNKHSLCLWVCSSACIRAACALTESWRLHRSYEVTRGSSQCPLQVIPGVMNIVYAPFQRD